jgi:serine/threonine protein kinase
MAYSSGDGHGVPAVPAQGEVSRRGWEVPGYAELKTLGSGGFGDVVLARHQVSGTLVAVKYLHQTLLADPEFPRMFRAEARVLASLEDRNIVRLYEYVESPSGAAIVMELIDGVSVRQILARHGATTAEAALVVLQGSLLGLAAAHARGVVHRDYKPENVLVDAHGASKLTDFGIAARAGDTPVPAGTLAYAPPEQFAGGPASPAGDVYAATATFYECLTGRPPFTGDSVERMLYQHLYEPVPMETVPTPLQPLVAAGMAKDPAYRPSDAAAFVTRLRNVAGGAYGPDWEDRGRSNLGGATLLLAALWPSGTAPVVHGSAAAQVHLSRPPQAHPSGKPGSSHESRHLQHERHEEHLRHVRHEQHLRHLRRLRRLSRPRMALAVTAAAGVVVAAVLLLPHGHPAPASHHSGNGGGPAATANEAKARVTVVATGSTILGGPLLGPDGRLWVVATSPATGKPILQAVNPTTYAVSSYPLPSSLGGSAVTYSGAAAFDGAGHLWLGAGLADGQIEPAHILLRYTPGSGTLDRFAEDSGCATNPGSPDELFSASDGAVWDVCAANILGGGAFYFRLSPDGAITNVQIVNNAQPGSTLYLANEQLPSTGLLGPLAPGPGGTMWGIPGTFAGSSTFIQLAAGGQETQVEAPGPTIPIQLVGNGTTSTIESVGTCIVNDAQGEHDRQCVSVVNPDGTETEIAEVLDYDGYNDHLVHWAVMDRSGDVWVIIVRTPAGQPPNGQYYLEVSPGGATKVFPFTVPGDSGWIPVSLAPPVITANGGLWTQDAASRYKGALVEVVPS